MKIVSINEMYEFTAKGSVGSYEKMELKEAIKIVYHLDVLLCACILIIYKLRFHDIKS